MNCHLLEITKTQILIKNVEVFVFKPIRKYKKEV